jgi:hypothetical protein
MLIIEHYIKNAARYLNVLSGYTTTLSKLNLHDTSVISENFFSQLLNVAYGYELANANLITHNASVIDLYDTKNRVSVQVTSTKELGKVKDCLKRFKEKKLYEEYDILLIYILSRKQKSYKLDTVKEGSFEFDPKIHVIDMDDLLNKMLGLPIEKQKKIIDILKDGIIPPNDEPIVSNEVETILNLINLLSESQKGQPFDEETDIDPNKKIDKRFKDASTIVENQYFNLCLEYASILNSVEQNNDFDAVKHSKVASYLKDCSTRLLIEHNYDAMKAFDNLKADITQLFHNSFISYDDMAIKFFLLKSLTECDVFPLLRAER